MKPQSSFIFSWILLVCFAVPFESWAQEAQNDSTDIVLPVDSLIKDQHVELAVPDAPNLEEVDTVPPRVFYPFMKSVSVVFDYGKLFGYLTGVEKKNEIGLQLNIKKNIVAVAEGGYSILNPNSSYTNAGYQVKGNYFRLGAGISKKIDDKNGLTFTFRYAMASFEDLGTTKISSSSGLFDPYGKSFSRKSLSASWYEFVLGSESRIRPKDLNEKPKLYLGFYFRLRVMDKYDIQEPYDVFSIPGYGRTFDNTVPALNLYMRYIISSR